MRKLILLIFFTFYGIPGFAIDNPGEHSAFQLTDRGYYYEEPAEGVIRILTYNIRNCIGMDGKTDFDRVADVIIAINPHVVALQEVDSATRRMDGTDVLKILAEKTDMYYRYGPAISFQGGKYGNGVLSWQEPVGYSYIPLPGRQEKRSMLMVEFDHFILYGTHLNNRYAGDRHGSVMIIDYEAKGSEKPVILAGDINDTPGSRTLELLAENWVQLSGNDYTFRSDNPDRCIDYIFGLKMEGVDYKVLQQVVVNEFVASDHLPVLTLPGAVSPPMPQARIAGSGNSTIWQFMRPIARMWQ